MDGQSEWGELPEHVVERILQCLPWECLFRFRIVCKQWNNLLSSAHFRNLWRAAAAKQPWLLLCMPNAQMGSCLVFSFFTGAWRTVSLSFLPERSHLNYKGSAAGLLLADIPARSSTGNAYEWRCVCNPLSRKCMKLPGMLSITTVMARGIVCGHDRESYKVVVVGESRSNSVVVEVFNSINQTWKIAGKIPECISVIENEHMVFCNGFFFCMTLQDGILAYDIQKESWTSLPMPTTVTNNLWPRLMACGSSLVMARLVKRNHVLKEVIIWELCLDQAKHPCNWREIGRMPNSLCQDLHRSSFSSWFECAGVGDKVCFRSHGSLEVLVFSLAHRSWSWLPKCPATYADSRLRTLAFEPRPDMDL
eukprot:Gb_31804 [translate_table: standard]